MTTKITCSQVTARGLDCTAPAKGRLAGNKPVCGTHLRSAVSRGEETRSLGETVTVLVGDCDRCGQAHEAEHHHEGSFGEGAIYAVTCPEDGLTQFHTTEGVYERQVVRHTAASLGLDLR